MLAQLCKVSSRFFAILIVEPMSLRRETIEQSHADRLDQMHLNGVAALHPIGSHVS